MHKNKLPGDGAPYFIEAGEGTRFQVGTFLATVIAREQDTGGLMSASILTGAAGSQMPLHRHPKGFETIYLLSGVASLELDGKAFELTQGDYAFVPPGVAHGFTFRDVHTKFLACTFGGNANEIYGAIGKGSEAVYAEDGGAADWSRVPESIDFQLVSSDGPRSAGEKAKVAPPEEKAYVIASGEGERMLAAEQLYTFLTDRRQTRGTFLAVLTEGPKGPRIPKHKHEKHTETFFGLHGALDMMAGDENVVLHPGDFLHVPAETPHSFQITGNNTFFIGFLAPGIFEPFFRYLCDPYEGHMFKLPPPPFRFDRVLQHLSELDLKLLERPGGPPPGP